MTSITKDPLLAIAKGVLWFLMGVMAVATAACLAAIPLLWIFQGRIAEEIAEQAANFPTGSFVTAISALLALAAAMLAMIFRLFQLLKRIVATVGDGDPFVPVNATRLTHMAWLTLGVQIVTAPMAGLAMFLMNITKDFRDPDQHLSVDGGLDGNGLLLMLILFILARVFREGTRLRDEVEGTV